MLRPGWPPWLWEVLVESVNHLFALLRCSCEHVIQILNKNNNSDLTGRDSELTTVTGHGQGGDLLDPPLE